MVRTAEKIRDLVDEDPALEDVLLELLDREDEIRWRDVKGDLSSGQWGRLLQKDILVEGDDGFVFEDGEGVRDALIEDESSTSSVSDADIPEGGVNWTTYDKVAGIVALLMFAGYSLSEVRGVVGGVMDVLLGPLESALPFYLVILVLAVITGVYSTILQSELMDMEVMGAYQQRMKDIQDRQKAAKERGDDAELERIREEQMEAMGDQLGMFKAQFRPMVWIMVLTIPVFLWMYWKILNPDQLTALESTLVLPFAGEVQLQDGIVGPMQAWIVWYFLCSVGFSQIIRKSLNIQTTPT
jgi:uncharacterized membrane protein (DUF106 family)